MDVKEFNSLLYELVIDYNSYQRLVDDLDKMDKLINSNEKQLTDSLIKIPFTRFYFVDGLGIFKHHVPALLKRNRQLIISYNAKLTKAQSINNHLHEQLALLRCDYLNSDGEELKAKDKMINQYLEKLK